MSGYYGAHGGGGRQYDDYVDVWTDGSCPGNGQYNRGGIGIYWGRNHPWNFSDRAEGRTNNSCEIEAARIAIEIAKSYGVEKLRINTDSKFLFDSMVKWMPQWLQNDWENSRGEEVINRRDFERLNDELDGSIRVFWKFVYGHSGDRGNEEADRLARDGARS
ncbi:ribonuclease H1-like [Lutzomyia longipalpis]|uniref:ribonuclease H1-like n=1 Tax=Lutzomyia longipalpis TaxID=7200 RepID=UPI0024845FDE|nr:ribonuclease H1-like [Lutzomyia longipalpis]